MVCSAKGRCSGSTTTWMPSGSKRALIGSLTGKLAISYSSMLPPLTVSGSSARVVSNKRLALKANPSWSLNSFLASASTSVSCGDGGRSTRPVTGSMSTILPR